MKYITGDELAKIIKSDKVANRDYLVVDVRDDDYAGGNIKSALNLPSREFQMSAYDLVQKTADVKTMIFHCALSQMRGPKAARIYEETRSNLNLAREKPQEVYVLRDGFTDFQRRFKDDPALVENWEEEVWANAEDWS
ncbi:Rhodanese-like domain-containing protein [Mycena alexandri]|uniref:Rhodanese-like domain-containing protein n=1 Tax=Mycena alexandri TaxID=1745969 RepID=A0AAD6SP74_9AGAR|nr:Rhodanese-like domain-containing protein [Mycena alexandri]